MIELNRVLIELLPNLFLSFQIPIVNLAIFEIQNLVGIELEKEDHKSCTLRQDFRKKPLYLGNVCKSHPIEGLVR